MQIHIYDHPEQVGIAAAMIIGAQILKKPNAVLGLATGSTPIPVYQQLTRLHREGILDFSSVVTFNLDEYCGIPKTHHCSYYYFMQKQLFEHINIIPSNTHVPNGCASDIPAECRQYDGAIQQAGGIDLQLLGIGRNGHIGFNEPYDQFIYGCHMVELSASTISDNQRFFNSEDQVPHRAISMGVGSIMEAKTVLLVATGIEKSIAVKKALDEDINPETQVSILRTHPNGIFLLDRSAASDIMIGS